MANSNHHCPVSLIMSITFQVVDVSCEAADASFFVPQIQLSCASTTKFATLYGYSEFGNTPSSPPKKYKTITFNGFSERVGFTAEQTPRQCGGGKYIYSGVGQVDSKGNVTSKWLKNFYSPCSKQFWPFEPLQTAPGAIRTPNNQFVGYCWPSDPNSCPTCDFNDAHWPLLSNQYTGVPQIDLGAFMHNVNDPVVTTTSWSVNDVFYGLTSINESGSWSVIATDTSYTVTVGPNAYPAQSVFTNPSVLVFPVVSINGIAGEYIVFTDTNNYSAVLSNEYTDAEALANATVVTGTGCTAANLPRTTGFTSIFTDVAFSLKFTNLQNGKNYEATVQLLEQKPGNIYINVSTRTYDFTATGPTHQIDDTLPTPDPGKTITVRQPKVSIIT